MRSDLEHRDEMIPTPPSEQRYRGSDYAARNPTWHREDSAWKAAQIVRCFSDGGLSPRSVLEVGCGAGEILASLARLMPESVRLEGWDIAPAAIELAHSRASGRVDYRLGDYLESDTPAPEVVLCVDVFEHVEDYLGFLRRLRAKGQTYTVFHIPLDLTVWAVLRGSVLPAMRASVGHLHHFTRETALATLADAGYEVIRWRYTAGSLELPPATWRVRVLNGPRRLIGLASTDLAARLLGGWSLLVLAR